jgi:hypothetical protein
MEQETGRTTRPYSSSDPSMHEESHTSSSSAMEPLACLAMVVNLFEQYNVVVQRIVADDDSSTRALLKWSNADYMINHRTNVPPTIPISKGPNKGKPHPRPDKGRLPASIPEPIFVADPGHRKKVLTGEFQKLLAKPVNGRFTFTKADSIRIGKNFAYMIRQLPRLPESEYENTGKAVLGHHFDDHTHCGPWCRRKILLARGLAGDNDNKKRFYRSMEKDANLYKVLNSIVSRFVTVDRLKEVAHGMDTQANESLNNTFSWLAPKNKVYCGSQSLQNRLSIGLGINMLGTQQYFKRLFVALGVFMTSNVKHYLSVKESNRAKRITKSKATEVKKRRKESYFETQRKEEAIARQARKKRDGTYRTGQNMDDDSSDDNIARPTRRPAARSYVCPHCGKSGHKTTTSKKCLLYNGGRGANDTAEAAAVVPTAQEIAELGREQYNDDGMPLTEDLPSDVSLSYLQGTDDVQNSDVENGRGLL